MRADGLRYHELPALLTKSELEAARKVVSFGELPVEYRNLTDVEVWSVPPVSENYEVARTAIVERVRQLIRDLSISSLQ